MYVTIATKNFEVLNSFTRHASRHALTESRHVLPAFLFLASEQLSGYMTGQILEVNGGQYMP